MAINKDVLVPDLGNVAEAEIIEIAVKQGEQVNKDDPLITLESDKASIEIPAPFTGIIETMTVKVGQKVSAGSLIAVVRPVVMETGVEQKPVSTEPATPLADTTALTMSDTAAKMVKDVMVPDIGTAGSAEVIEILVQPGSIVALNDPLITLEGDKATMEIPSPLAGTVKELKIKTGEKLATGSVILTIETRQQDETVSQISSSVAVSPAPMPVIDVRTPVTPSLVANTAIATTSSTSSEVHAGPGVRRFARELGVNLAQVKGSGAKSRILKEDVQAYVKQALAAPQSTTAGSGLPASPVIDFSRFGVVETKPLSRIKRLTGINLSRNWLLVPHVTQFEDADITELDAFRKAQQVIVEKEGVKLTPLAFIMKAVVASLKAFPHFNASLDASGENLILKHYYHIGVAVETSEGLVVPVIRDVDQKSITELARELATVSLKARNKALNATDMQGSTFTISSLGGIGGTAFTPIVNLPDVAILGISKAAIKPVYQAGQFMPRLILPLSLSYDHRVIDGAEGARFIVHLATGLADIRRLLL